VAAPVPVELSTGPPSCRSLVLILCTRQSSNQCPKANILLQPFLSAMTLSWVMRNSTQGRVLLRVCVVMTVFFTIKTSLGWSFRFRTTPTTTTSQLQTGLHPAAARVIKVSMLYGASNSLYERALDTHKKHSERWGHRFQVLREDLTSGFWNKPAYLLYSVTQELAKPADDRAEWLM
jgi:hypothetical protein